MPNHLLTDTTHIREYLFGCVKQAVFTLQSARTGTRFTYRVRRARSPHEPFFFCDALTGPENESDYSFFGAVSRDLKTNRWKFHWSCKSQLDAQAPAAEGFDWFIERINYNAPLQPTKIAFYYSGRCSHCGRLLTTPESLERGLGPKCAEKATALV